MILKQLSCLSDEEKKSYLHSLKLSVIAEYAKYNTLKKNIFSKYKIPLNRHFLNKKNIERFCAFTNNNADFLSQEYPHQKATEIFFDCLREASKTLLLEHAKFFTKDFILGTFARKIEYLDNIEDSDSDKRYICISGENQPRALIKITGEGSFEKYNNELAEAHYNTYFPYAQIEPLFVKNVISALLYWFKEPNAKYESKLLFEKILFVQRKKHRQFYSVLAKELKNEIDKPSKALEFPINTLNTARHSTATSIEIAKYLSQNIITGLENYGSNEHSQLLKQYKKAYLPRLKAVNLISDYVTALREYRLPSIGLVDFDIMTAETLNFMMFLEEFKYSLKTSNMQKILPKIANDKYKQKILYSKRALAPVRLPKRLKAIAQKSIFVNRLFFGCDNSHLPEEYHHTTTMPILRALHNLNISNKAIVGFMDKFFTVENYICSVGNDDNKFVFGNHRLFHDAINCLSLFRQILKQKPESTFSISTKEYANFLNKLLSVLATYNINETSLSQINTVLSVIFVGRPVEEIGKIILMLNQQKFNSAKEIFSIVSSFDETKLKLEIDTISATGIHIHDKTLDYAALSNATKRLVAFYRYIADKTNFKAAYNEVPLFDTIEFSLQGLLIGLYPHNHPVGITGALAKGVCIDAFGDERLKHINSNFLNLCVHNDSNGIILWGLVCIATDSNNGKWLVLNNLQGSINSNKIDTKQIREDILKIFNISFEKYGLAGILFNDVGFNALRLCDADFGEFKKLTNTDFKIFLDYKNAKLDFSHSPASGEILSSSSGLKIFKVKDMNS